MTWKRRARRISAGPAPRTRAWSDYAFLRLADLISLTFCNGWRDQEQDHGGYSVRGDDEGVLVTPDPFGSARIRMDVPAVRIPDAPLASSADLLKAIGRGERQTLTGVARGR